MPQSPAYTITSPSNRFKQSQTDQASDDDIGHPVIYFLCIIYKGIAFKIPGRVGIYRGIVFICILVTTLAGLMALVLVHR